MTTGVTEVNPDDFYVQNVEVRPTKDVLMREYSYFLSQRIGKEILKEEGMDHAEDELVAIDEKLEELQKDVVKKFNDSDDYDELVDEIQRLRDRKAEILKRRTAEVGNEEKIARIREYLKEKKRRVWDTVISWSGTSWRRSRCCRMR